MAYPGQDVFVCPAGEAELFKGGMHLGMFGLATTFASYNAMAFTERHEWHLAKMAVAYAVLAYFEFKLIRRHLRRLA